MADDLDARAERKKGEILGLAAGGLLAAALVAFVVQNTAEVSVEWLAWDLSAPLWVVMAVTAAGAVVFARIVAFMMRRRGRS